MICKRSSCFNSLIFKAPVPGAVPAAGEVGALWLWWCVAGTLELVQGAAEALAEAADDAELGVASGVRAGCLNCSSIGGIIAFPRDSNVLTVISPCLMCSALSVGRS